MTKHDIKKGDHIFLVDGSGYIFRAYHALPPLTRKSDKMPVGAVSGFCNMLFKLLNDMRDSTDAPTHLGVVFDPKGDTFRNEIYPDYKAHRPPPPEDLVPQFPLVRHATEAFGVPAFDAVGFEADDVIATYARVAAEQGARVTIVSSDKDLMQLVGDKISMRDTMKDRHIDTEAVIEKFGVRPERVIDVQALAGDSVDNVPGVPGIGIKTAAQLIDEYGDLDSLLARAEEIKQPKRRDNLVNFAEQARISRALVTLRQDTPLPVAFEAMRLGDLPAAQLIAFLKAMEFRTITKRVADSAGLDADAITPRTDLAVAEDATQSAPTPTRQDKTDSNVLQDFAKADYVCVTEKSALAEWVAKAYRRGVVAVDTETDSLDAKSARLVGISLCVEAGRAAYIPLLHGAGDGLELDGDVPAQLALADIKDVLSPLLADASVLKIFHNAKFDMLVLKSHGIEVAGFDDTMLMSYVLGAGKHAHGMDALCERLFDHKPIAYSDIVGAGKAKVTFDAVPLDKATRYAAEDADITLRFWEVLKPLVVREGLVSVYETLERALAPVLVAMEAEGIAIDAGVLSRLSGEFAQKMGAIEADIYKVADTKFNIASPKQLGEILFDKMGLAGGKKTKTGAYSTGAGVLEELAAQDDNKQGNALARLVLDWRALAKLKSTYTDALPEFVNAETHRVHTSYAMAATTTGRLSSSDPNLQNIPIRTEDGRRIRTAFIAEAGNVLVSADYSQIELRLLAHIADIDALKKAFADGLDIHAMTASEMFGVPIAGMEASVRRRAKAINFGIIYGISAFGLANQLGIGRGEAGDYINAYFKKFPGIRDYMEATKATAREKGFVETIFGRRIHFPDIQSKQHARRAFMERAAINAPIQGAAADIIRRAMVRIPPALNKAKLKGQMLLQVHDELIFETPEAQAERLIKIVCAVMQEACAPAVSLSVPLVVEAQAARNWDEAH